MAKLTADSFDVSGAKNFLAQHPDLAHIGVRRYGPLLILESGSDGDRHARARLRRVTKQWWTLEMPTHTGRWEPTPFRGQRDELLQALIENFGWTLMAT